MSNVSTDRDEDVDNNIETSLDPLTHAEFLVFWRHAVDNIRYSKTMQWRILIYYSAICVFSVTVCMCLYWTDETLTRFLFYTTWLFSFCSITVLVSLQIWQAGEQRRIDFMISKMGSWTKDAASIRSRIAGDFQRYSILGLMILYIEMASFAFTRIMWPNF